jgi:glycosyltransferase involved in cell wall biosynthesis
MKLCYLTNIWNHHQGEVCREFAKLLGDDFKLCLYQPLDHHWSLERIGNGWDLMPPDESWILGPPKMAAETPKLFAGIMSALEAADVVVASLSPLAPPDFYQRIVKPGKLTFMMGERFFRNKITLARLLNPRFWNMIRVVRNQLNYPNVHYLTMNHYCADDLRLMRLCKDRIWTWGYLTSVPENPPRPRNNPKTRILWCGRMLECKRVDLLIEAVGLLRDRGCFEIVVEIIGDGEEKQNLQRQVESLNLQNTISFLPFLPKNDVRRKMQEADIYVFPSNRQEGWGAALSEAMSEGCAVVANREAGATLELIRDGENGFVFNENDAQGLASILLRCCNDASMRKRMGASAWRTMQAWTPRVGACRFVEMAEGMLANNSSSLFQTGLCAKRG